MGKIVGIVYPVEEKEPTADTTENSVAAPETESETKKKPKKA